MLLTRISLRNYRVYEHPLDLELPPGLIGIYGPNGSGKSTLLEAILFALWGKARTGKEDVRTAGVGGECVAEVSFEHEGHLYLVRRSLTGINLTAKAEVHCDGLAMAEGVRDASRYLHQVLGMDDAAFRASVFAEQKQLAAFSDKTPAERRQLVLQLLGITPLDSARDAARKDARETRQQHDRLRGMLPDLDRLRVEAADAAAAAEAAAVVANTEDAAAAAARAKVVAAEEAFSRLDQLRQEYDALVIEGRGARSQLDEAVATVDRLEGEQASLVAATEELDRARPEAAGLADVVVRLDGVAAVVRAERALAAVVVPPEPPPPDVGAVERSQQLLDTARAGAARLAGQVAAAGAELARAREQATRSAELSGEADCPLCGQALGDAFEQVRAHRAAEVEEAERRRGGLEAACQAADHELAEATAAFTAQREEAARRLAARQSWEQARVRHAGAAETLESARRALLGLGPVPDGSLVPLEAALRAEVESRRGAAATVARLQGVLERQGAVASQLEQARERAALAEHRVVVLRDKLRSLAFDPAALAAAAAAHTAARQNDQVAARSAADARLAAATALAHAEGEARRVADGEAQHAALASLADDSRHLGRLADLLTSFRNTIVATVGPRLALQAAELFGELTDHEYDRLEVDPETYELQICDGGRVFQLDRFSGSEVDLANLALRVAISEHVRFQSGGTVGLLVLDEVFGPLDEERKARMLQALERLRGRFRQILVVTHDTDIKEQLPYAVEVQKLPGRRASAHLLNA
ncbi:MAG TPA: SMC family ATPase [Acidimicrobiales bacterium]|nr:SMC family ATPase [Acidimicrobiales bacterium]